jgi:hypothetical protein
MIFMIPFGFLILQILYLFDSVKTSYLKTFSFIQNERLRDFGLVSTFFFFIYWAVGGMIMLKKDILMFVYFGSFILWQIGWSLINKVYPYLSLTLYFVVLLGYQMFLANCDPIIWFELNTFLEIAVFWGSLIVVYLVGSVIQRLCIGVEIVNQILF